MDDPFVITAVRFTAASVQDARRGLLGWVSFTLNRSLRVDSVSIRRTLTGELRLSFPSRRDASGRRHFAIRPIDDRARLAIEAHLFRAMGLLIKWTPEVKEVK